MKYKRSLTWKSIEILIVLKEKTMYNKTPKTTHTHKQAHTNKNVSEHKMVEVIQILLRKWDVLLVLGYGTSL